MTHCVHLDYASTAPLRATTREAMSNVLNNENFDPRRLYNDAAQTRYEIEAQREKVAAFVGCDPFEVIFTSSSSESLAMFAYGVIPTLEQSFRDASASAERFNVITSPYDSDVLHETWHRENIDVQYLAGNDKGTLDLARLSEMITDSTRAISLPYAHPDTGTLQDITEVVKVVRSLSENCLIHVDARIAYGYAKISFANLGVDAITIDPVVFGGPAGVAAIILKYGRHLSPLLAGSTQERARRAGLENVIGVAGFGGACEEVTQHLPNELARYQDFSSQITNALVSSGARIIVEDSPRLSNIVAAYFPGIAASAVVAEFNRMGINIHAGSSCGSEEFEPSRALAPITGDDAISESVFRISVGWATTSEDIALFIDSLGHLQLPR